MVQQQRIAPMAPLVSKFESIKAMFLVKVNQNSTKIAVKVKNQTK